MPKKETAVIRGDKDFSFSVFRCDQVPNICVMGCCCGCMQWADTMQRAGFMHYWRAFCVFFFLTVLYPYTWGIAPIVLVAVGVIHRQKLRRSYSIEAGTARSVVCDFCAWCICQPCAIIQEAREASIGGPRMNVAGMV